MKVFLAGDAYGKEREREWNQVIRNRLVSFHLIKDKWHEVLHGRKERKLDVL